MGILKKLNKAIKVKPTVMMVDSVFEDWEKHLDMEPAKYLQDLIDEIHKNHPWYKYQKSDFEYTADGHIRFRLRFVKREIAKTEERMTGKDIDAVIKTIETLI